MAPTQVTLKIQVADEWEGNRRKLQKLPQVCVGNDWHLEESLDYSHKGTHNAHYRSTLNSLYMYYLSKETYHYKIFIILGLLSTCSSSPDILPIQTQIPSHKQMKTKSLLNTSPEEADGSVKKRNGWRGILILPPQRSSHHRQEETEKERLLRIYHWQEIKEWREKRWGGKVVTYWWRKQKVGNMRIKDEGKRL